LQDSVEFLLPPLGGETSNFFFQTDSPISLQNTIDSVSSEHGSTATEGNLMDEEQLRRVVEMIDERMEDVSFENDMLTSDNWEDMLSMN
jgi:hypothetical protein